MTREEIEKLIEKNSKYAADLGLPLSPDIASSTAEALKFLLSENEAMREALKPFAATAEQLDRVVEGARRQEAGFETPKTVYVHPLPDDFEIVNAARWHDPHPVSEMIVLYMENLRAARAALTTK